MKYIFKFRADFRQKYVVEGRRAEVCSGGLVQIGQQAGSA